MELAKDPRLDVLKKANYDVDKIFSECLEKLYNTYLKEQQKLKTEVPHTSAKYILALKFVNKILENIGKPQINVLTDFVRILRNDIIKQENIDVLNNMEDEIYQHFNKVKCGYYRKDILDTYILTLLRGMSKDLGLKCEMLKTSKCIKRKIHSFYVYSIVSKYI